MEDNQRIRIVASMDLVVSIIIIIIGISSFIYYGAVSENIQDMIELNEQWASDYGMENPYQWMEGLPILVLLFGIIALVYGIERMTSNILKIIATKKQKIKHLNEPRYPIQPPNTYQR